MTDKLEPIGELFIKLYLMICTLAMFPGASYAQDTPRYDVVSEYVRQLGTIHGLQQTAAREFKEAHNQHDQMLDIIRNSARMKLELNRNIYAFKAMRVATPYETLLPHFIEFYEKKFELYDTMARTAAEFLSGPKPGVDYGKIEATMPEISAKLEYLDKGLYEATPMFCFLLVDEKPDSKGRLSHLIITRSQRAHLAKRIDTLFGARLSDKNPNYTVGSAALIKTFLVGDHKSSDDPW